MSKADVFIREAEQWGAKNYKPLPIVIEKAEGIWVWDPDGQRYMDMLSSYSALNQGHRHPRIISALIEQADRVTLTSRAFHNDRMGPFLHKLCETTGYEKALLMNTGSEAVETALKAARKWGYDEKGVAPDKAEIIAFENNFAGRTISVISFSSEEDYKRGFGPFTPGFKIVPYDDVEAFENAITSNTVAVILEPIQGEGGIIIPSFGYLKKIREITAANNVLMIADEIQTGFGRTGKMFACDHEGVRPDIVTLGKALGGGVFPVSAAIADDSVMKVFTPGIHGSTFGGNPLACAVGMASIDVILEEHLPERSAELGEYFIKQLRTIKSPVVKEIRGRGLFIGIEVKRDYGTARPFCEKLMKLNLLCKETHEQTIRLAPPLVIKKEEIDWALERIERVLTDT
jgi:ornithine--oxo-acid transaminase